jgi:hypothetical protein
MIDWFIVLIPLALLPVFLLFVFVGCPLDREGLATPVGFGYEGGLGTDVQRFDAAVSGPESLPPLVTLTRIEQGTPPLQAAGEEGLTLGFVGIDSEGDVTCTCTITLKPVDEFTAPEVRHPNKSKHKMKEEDAPSFRLERDEDDFVVN